MTDILRESGGIWTWNVEQDILQLKDDDYDNNTVILIQDVRFENELEMLRRHRAIFINVFRPEGHSLLDHVSETGLAGADYTLYNDGDMTDLKFKVDNILNFIFKTKNTFQVVEDRYEDPS
jgi:hypothetical protein